MKRLLTLISIVMLTVSFSSAQTWNTVGNGLSGNFGLANPDFATDTSNGEIYIAHTELNTSTFNFEVTVRKWNGLSWFNYPKITGINYKVEDIVINDTIIYIIGGTVVTTPNIAFYEFNGTSWSAKAPTGFSGTAYTGEMINGELVVGGDFWDGNSIEDIFRYDGTNYFSYPVIGNIRVTDILEYNGDMYVASPSSAAATIDGLKKYTGSSWSSPAHYHQGTSTLANDYRKLFEFQNELYVTLGPNEVSLFRLGNDTLHLKGFINHEVDDIEVYNNEVYFVGDTILGSPLERMTKYDGFNLTSIFFAPGGIESIDVLDTSLYVFSKSVKDYNGITYNYAFRTQANFSIINGFVYTDVNKDCFRNNLDPDITGAIVELSGNKFFASTGNNGFYSMALPAGTYSFDTVYIPGLPNKNFIQNCTLLNQVTLGANQTVTQNLGLVNVSSVDMMVLITPYRGLRARFGFTELYQIDVINTGTITQTNASIVVEVPPSLTFGSSIPAPSSTLPNNKLVYNFSNIEPQERKTIAVSVKIDTNQNALNDTICWRAYFSPTIVGDADTSDNSDTVKQRIVGAYDPNDKYASASTILTGTDHIDYHINFQNTGNDTAYKVTIVDTLDLSIPIVSVMINAASHAYNLSVINNILVWEFENILLPDSGANFIGSQGFVNFTVNISQGLAVGDTVKNDAQIYFDYQSPIYTNTAKTLVIEPFDIGIKESNKLLLNVQAYPNPANNGIYLESNAADLSTVQIIDINGKVLDTLIIEPGRRVYYPVQNLSSGIYFIQENNLTLKFMVNR